LGYFRGGVTLSRSRTVDHDLLELRHVNVPHGHSGGGGDAGGARRVVEQRQLAEALPGGILGDHTRALDLAVQRA
jgi:hypothetical protein